MYFWTSWKPWWKSSRSSLNAMTTLLFLISLVWFWNSRYFPRWVLSRHICSFFFRRLKVHINHRSGCFRMIFMKTICFLLFFYQLIYKFSTTLLTENLFYNFVCRSLRLIITNLLFNFILVFWPKHTTHTLWDTDWLAYWTSWFTSVVAVILRWRLRCTRWFVMVSWYIICSKYILRKTLTLKLYVCA